MADFAINAQMIVNGARFTPPSLRKSSGEHPRHPDSARVERADHLRLHDLMIPVYIEDDACYTAVSRAYEKQNIHALGPDPLLSYRRTHGWQDLPIG